MSLTLAEHRTYLKDEARLTAYRQALAAVIRPGDVVLDLGTGTGVLGMLAVEAGAGRVYAVDGSEMLAVAGAVVSANGLTDRITLVKGHSRAIQLPEKADVVIADQLGAFGIEADALASYRDAVRRHVKAEHRLVPPQVVQRLAPAQADDVWEAVSFWDEPSHGIDVTAVAKHARNARHYTNSAVEDLLAAPAQLAALDLATHDNAPIRGRLEWEITRAGTFHGLAGWFEAELAPGITISNSPLDARRLDRSNLLLPAAQPVAVVPGDRVSAHIHIVPPDSLARWTLVVTGADGDERARSSHSTVDVMLSAEDLARTRPDFMPALGPHGEARRTLFTLMDGETRLDELERTMWERHQNLFDSPADAAVFVGQMVAREGS